MRSVIPPGTWYYGSQWGHYNFLYPASEPTRSDRFIEVLSPLPWLKQNGLVAYRTADGVVWCEESSIR